MATTARAPEPVDRLGAGDGEGGARPSRITVLTRTVLPLAIVLITLVTVTRRAAAPLANPDTFFHLRFGHELLDHWTLRHPGHVTSWATADWVPTQWLPQELMAHLEDWFGLPGVAWYAGLQFMVLTVCLYAAARRWSAPVVAAPLLAIALLVSSPGLSMRPQVLSYLATVLLVWLWLSVRYGEEVPAWRPWLAVPLVWLWAMCHGMWPLGIVVSIAAVTGILLDRRRHGRSALALTTVPVLCGVAAGLLTPVGPALLPAVLTVNSRSEFFPEWAPPNFRAWGAMALLGVLLVTVLVMVRRGADWTSIALVGTATLFAVYSARTVPVAACLLAPLAAFQLQRLVGPVPSTPRRERWVVGAGAVACLVVLGALVPTTSAHPPPQPDWVDPTLTAMPAGTRILNESAFGGFLMWRYPDLDFMFSGYGDIYTDEELQTMVRIRDLQPGWDDLVRDAQPAYALLSPDSALTYALSHGEGWTVVRASDDVELLAPPSGWMDQTAP